MIDCGSRELLGWRLSKRGNAPTAEAALEEALINRFGHLHIRQPGLVLRSDNGLVFTAKNDTHTVKFYGLTQEFITPYSPQQNGVAERFVRSIKEACVWMQRFESIAHAQQVISRWIRYDNTERPHQALNYKPPIEAFVSVA